MKHSLARGREVIDGLERLGVALGYEVRKEQRVGRTAAVDLSWTAAQFNDVPLFVFEVESTASAGLANNATKVYGSPLEELAKPLFFFHLVLTGQPNNERIRNAERAWGQHNYRIYRFHTLQDRQKLVLDILSQHRRVNQRIRPLAVADALDDPTWADHPIVQAALSHVEDLGFIAPYLHDYATLACGDERFLPLYARRLRKIDDPRPTTADLLTGSVAQAPQNEEGYLDAPGSYIPGLIETAVRIYAGDVPDSDGPALLERWATSSGFGRRIIEAAFGLSRDYDQFVILTAPVHYVWAATILRNHPHSREWVVKDLATLVQDEHDRGLRPPLCWPAMIWLAHTLAAQPSDDHPGEVGTLYRHLQEIVAKVGGIPISLLLDPPPPYGDLASPDEMEWLDALGAEHLPSANDLRDAVLTQIPPNAGERPGPVGNPWQIYLSALLGYEAYQRSTKEFLRDVYVSTD